MIKTTNKLVKLIEIDSDLKHYRTKLKLYESYSGFLIYELKINLKDLIKSCKSLIKSLEKTKKKILLILTEEERLLYEVGGYD